MYAGMYLLGLYLLCLGELDRRASHSWKRLLCVLFRLVPFLLLDFGNVPLLGISKMTGEKTGHVQGILSNDTRRVLSATQFLFSFLFERGGDL